MLGERISDDFRHNLFLSQGRFCLQSLPEERVNFAYGKTDTKDRFIAISAKVQKGMVISMNIKILDKNNVKIAELSSDKKLIADVESAPDLTMTVLYKQVRTEYFWTRRMSRKNFSF